jgi:DNA polymerase II large subunit
LDSIEDARKVKGKVVEILFLGDMLVAFGEFLRNNQPMLGACWCEEWWIETIRNSEKYQSFSDEEKESFDLESLQTRKFTAEEAFKYT